MTSEAVRPRREVSMATTRLTLSPAFPDLIARTGLSLRAFARRAPRRLFRFIAP